MIAFGTAMDDPVAFRLRAEPGIRRAVEPDSALLAFAAVGSAGIGYSYNLVLDAAARHADLEALVLVDQDAELTDPDVCGAVRRALADPAVGACGPLGATGVRSIAWWDGEVSAGPVTHRYTEHGEGEVPAFAWTDPVPAPAEVETLDGAVLVLSPWAVRNLRFDESLALGPGVELDYCARLRAAGRGVRTMDLGVRLHRHLELFETREAWVESHVRVAERLLERDRAADLDDAAWKARARRAEAEQEAARTIAYSRKSEQDALVGPLEREVAELSDTPSWRVTRPLRWANRVRADRATARAAAPAGPARGPVGRR